MHAHTQRVSPLYEVSGSPKRGGGGVLTPKTLTPPGSAPTVTDLDRQASPGLSVVKNITLFQKSTKGPVINFGGWGGGGQIKFYPYKYKWGEGGNKF